MLAKEGLSFEGLARETAEKLWDLGASIERGETLPLALPAPSKGKKHRRKTKV